MGKYLFVTVFGIKQDVQISNTPEELLYPLCGCRALQFKSDKIEISSHLLINTFQLSFDAVELIPTAEFK